MKFNTSQIDQSIFAQQVGLAYGIPITTVTFTPKGEDAYCFVARDTAGAHYFVRAQERDRGSDPEAVYAAVAALRDHCNLTPVLSPIRNRDGAFTWHYERFAVALFPFVAGASAFESGITDEQH